MRQRAHKAHIHFKLDFMFQTHIYADINIHVYFDKLHGHIYNFFYIKKHSILSVHKCGSKFSQE